ncbi:hypothetical protein KY284_013890 [Solanum tuberosum]|nr:hypothetical protein KY284_013890 [Solanum tuberosum]
MDELDRLYRPWGETCFDLKALWTKTRCWQLLETYWIQRQRKKTTKALAYCSCDFRLCYCFGLLYILLEWDNLVCCCIEN